MENKSALNFEKYVVDTIYYKINNKYNHQKKEVELPFSFDSKKIIDGNKMQIDLSINIFENSEINNYPFEMRVVLKGYFSLEGDLKNIQKFERNAIAILFPYLRAIVSTYTANANITTVILPAMNINKYFDKKYNL